MEFNEKLQELRKKKGITQEELAEILYVSRTAVSKWESGRGYPGIDSLKAIARFFSVTVDELLSGSEILAIAQEDSKQKENCFRDLIFGLFDISAAMLLLLPFFAQRTEEMVKSVSLLNLTEIALYLKIMYFVVIMGTIILGIATLALQSFKQKLWVKNKRKISLVFNALGVLLFILSLHPYAAAFLFIFLVIKAIILIKN